MEDDFGDFAGFSPVPGNSAAAPGPSKGKGRFSR